jgi:hypothetical protein
MNALPEDETTIFSETQNALWSGQSSQVYRITLDCPGTVRLTSSPGAHFKLYAKKCGVYDSCPTAYSIRYNYDSVVSGYGGTTYMHLDRGTWCLVVYGYSGSGTYSLRITSICPKPTPWPWPTPTPTPVPCGVYKTDTRDGFLKQGQAAVYGYSIPTDRRSKVEWTLTSSGPYPYSDNPIMMSSPGNPSIDSSYPGGSPVFDLYVFRDCNPKRMHCNTRYYSHGPYSHVSILNPTTGSIYYVMVYARSGSGSYHLTMNSYKCFDDNTPIIMASAGMETMTTEGYQDAGSGSEVSPPEAEFVISEGTE